MASRVLQLLRTGGETRREVVRLPAAVVLRADGGVEFVPVSPEASVVLSLGPEAPDRRDSLFVRHDEDPPRPLTAATPLRVGDWTVHPLDEARSAAQTVRHTATDLRFTSDGRVSRAAQLPDEHDASFPPPCFAAAEVDEADLRATGLPIVESRFLALGGGLGSFVWVDLLRVHGVPVEDIRVVGFEPVPYARYQRLCLQSQIPPHERLRSNSESCPDNVWGFPGYGMREAAALAGQGRLFAAARIMRQLSGEPDRADTYTPRADQVFASIDREAERIGWTRMVELGRVRTVRKTTDGRYVAAMSGRDADGRRRRCFFVAPYLHIALGYPGLQFLPDLRAWREQTGDFERVVNAYEDHEALYEHLASSGGTVLLRGRGIVASRILQRLSEVRTAGGDVEVIHLMRSRKTEGSTAGTAQRAVEHHWEFQPFNWPEAAWGGDLAQTLIGSSPEERTRLLRAWGGTTTADREDWRAIVRVGLDEGWYRIRFGDVEEIGEQGRVLTLRIREPDAESTVKVTHIIDATGLVSSVRDNPVYADLIARYELPLNPQGRFDVSPSFELERLRNGPGRAFLAGVAALGGPYAPVDSFLGLQYAAFAAREEISAAMEPVGPLRSLRRWWRWMRGAAP